MTSKTAFSKAYDIKHTKSTAPGSSSQTPKY